MFDVNQINKRYFDIKIGNIELQLEPPNVKIFNKIIDLSKTLDITSIEKLAEAVGMILNKNKTGYKVPAEIIEELDFDQLAEILTAYFEWIAEEKQSKNS